MNSLDHDNLVDKILYCDIPIANNNEWSTVNSQMDICQ